MVVNHSLRPLLKLINKPSKIASNLDWKKVSGGSVLSLDIHRDRIGVAVAPHPSYSQHHFSDDYDHYGTECHTLEPIRLTRTSLEKKTTNNTTSASCGVGDNNTTTLNQQHLDFGGSNNNNNSDKNAHVNPHHLFSEELKRVCRTRLLEICHENNVCGMVVAWPLQHDTGKMGAACGRVLYTLERLFVPALANQNEEEQHTMDILSKLPPMCLWDPQHFQELQSQNPPKDPEQIIDSFGRCAAYAKAPPDKDAVYRASHEQYYHDESMVAAQVWQDFSRVHWPHLYKNDYDTYQFEQQQQQQYEYGEQDEEDVFSGNDYDNLHEDLAEAAEEEIDVQFANNPTQQRLGHTGRTLSQERRGTGRSSNFHGSWGGIPSSVRNLKQSHTSSPRTTAHYNLGDYLVESQEIDVKKDRRIRRSLV